MPRAAKRSHASATTALATAGSVNHTTDPAPTAAIVAIAASCTAWPAIWLRATERCHMRAWNNRVAPYQVDSSTRIEPPSTVARTTGVG
jgi:hypothetical protein